MAENDKQLLIAGATGLVGYAAMKHFGQAGVKTTAISRRTPDDTFSADHLTLDLTDNDVVRAFAETQSDTTHLVYAALFEKPGLMEGWREADQIATNDAMLRNLLEPLEQTAKKLRHVTLLQGTKAYGAHVRPIDIPAREDRSEYPHDNFYWQQESLIRETAERAGWSWTILRPQIIFGEVIGAAMNLIPAIGAYSAILKSCGEPLHFPGGGTAILEAVDADLLARVIAWAGDTQTARNEIFNVTNGDVFTWRNVWPAIADSLGMEMGEERPTSLAQMLGSGDEEWAAIASEAGLAEPDLAKLLGESHHYCDFTMAYGAEGPLPAALVSTVKLRQAGFSEVMDTEVMFRKYFARLQKKGILPMPD